PRGRVRDCSPGQSTNGRCRDWFPVGNPEYEEICEPPTWHTCRTLHRWRSYGREISRHTSSRCRAARIPHCCPSHDSACPRPYRVTCCQPYAAVHTEVWHRPGHWHRSCPKAPDPVLWCSVRNGQLQGCWHNRPARQPKRMRESVCQKP